MGLGRLRTTYQTRELLYIIFAFFMAEKGFTLLRNRFFQKIEGMSISVAVQGVFYPLIYEQMFVSLTVV